MSVSLERAQRVLPIAYAIAMKLTSVSAWGISKKNGVFVVKINLPDGRVPGLPSRIQGVPISYARRGFPRQSYPIDQQRAESVPSRPRT